MANNKVYSNYLMHGRTKGSRNGISTTKGYRAVGHKARGRLGPDGRYIYDMSTHKKYVTDGLGSAGMGSNRRYELNTKSAKKNGIDVNFAQKTVNSLNKGADNPWQQRANAAQYKDLYRDASRSDTSRNTWQQNAKASEFRTRNVDVYDPATDSYQSMDRNKVKEYNKALVRKLEGTLPNTLGGATNQSSVKGTVTKPNTKGAQNNWQQQAIKNAAKGNLSNRVLNGETKAAKANNGTVYTAKELGYQGAVTKPNTPGINTATDPRFNPIGSVKIDHAKGVAWDKKHLRELQAGVAKERAKEIHDANIAGQNMAYENSKKAANAKAAEKSKAQGAKNNWQQAGNLTRSMTEVARDLGNRYDLEQKKKQQLSDASLYAHQARVADDYIKAQAHKNAQNQAYHRDLKQKGEKNNWQQQGADAQRKAEAKARWKAGNKAQAAKKSAEQGAKNNWQQQASKMAAKSTLANNILNGTTNAAKGKDGRVYTAKELGFTPKKATQKNAAEQGAKNNWQQKAAREAAGTDTKNRALGGSSKAVYMPRKVGGDAYVNPSNFEIDTERKPNKTAGANAMRNDPRYNLYESQKIEQAAVTRAKKSLNRNKKPVTSSKSNVSKIEKAITDALKKKKKKK